MAVFRGGEVNVFWEEGLASIFPHELECCLDELVCFYLKEEGEVEEGVGWGEVGLGQHCLAEPFTDKLVHYCSAAPLLI